MHSDNENVINIFLVKGEMMTLSFSLRIQNLLDPDVLRERYEIVNSIFSYTRICLPKWENQVFKILEIRPETLIK